MLFYDVVNIKILINIQSKINIFLLTLVISQSFLFSIKLFLPSDFVEFTEMLGIRRLKYHIYSADIAQLLRGHFYIFQSILCKSWGMVEDNFCGLSKSTIEVWEMSSGLILGGRFEWSAVA